MSTWHTGVNSGHVGEIASLGWPGNASQKRVRAGGGSWGERTLAQTRISGRKWMYGCNEMLKKKKKIVCLLYSRFKSVTITTGGSWACLDTNEFLMTTAKNGEKKNQLANEKHITCHMKSLYWLVIDGHPLQHNPFGTAGSLNADDRQRAGNQSVCSLQAFLQLAAQTGKLVIFDLYRPPRDHPFRDTWIQRTLEVIQNESSIHSSQVRLIYFSITRLHCEML